MQHFDASVIGAGVAGLSTALGLLKLGHHVAIVAPKIPSQAFDSSAIEYDQRVYAISLASERLLRNLGAWDFIAKERLCRYQDMRVWTDGAPLHFGCELIGRNDLGSIVEQQLLIAGLMHALAPFFAQLSWHEASVQDIDFSQSPPVIKTSAAEFSATLIVGADGAQSTTRQLAGFALDAKPYGHSAIVATVLCEESHQRTAWQRFLHSGPLAFLPLGDPAAYHGAPHRFASIVWSADTARAQQLMALPARTFAAQLANSFDNRLGEVELVGERVAFELIARHAQKYTRRHLALVADAAHTVHPLAGQGLNLGLLDVSELLTQISRAKSLDSLSALNKYERARRLENQIGLYSMASIKKLFHYQSKLQGAILQQGINGLNHSTWLRAQLAKEASGVHFDIFAPSV